VADLERALPPGDEVPVTAELVEAEDEDSGQTRTRVAAGQPRLSVSGRYGGWLGGLALLVGLVCVAFSYHSFWALPGSIVGLAVGIWALAGKRRGAAMVGIVICCIALSVSGYRALVVAYTAYTGYSPFDQGPVDEVFPEEEERKEEGEVFGDDW
jgi:hypothetical protein